MKYQDFKKYAKINQIVQAVSFCVENSVMRDSISADYDEREKIVTEKILNYLQEICPNRTEDEYDDLAAPLMVNMYEYQQICLEVGVQFGASLILNLLEGKNGTPCNKGTDA